MTVFIGFIWVVSGALAYMITLGHFQGKYPATAETDYEMDIARAVAAAILGPIGLVSAIVVSEFWQHGLRWK